MALKKYFLLKKTYLLFWKIIHHSLNWTLDQLNLNDKLSKVLIFHPNRRLWKWACVYFFVNTDNSWSTKRLSNYMFGGQTQRFLPNDTFLHFELIQIW